MEKLTAIIPVGNEEHNIEGVLKSVSFADEVMVVDSFSTDNTVELAKKYTNFIIQREYNYSASQKNWAIPQASHEWILIIDADERVTPELQKEIQEILKNPPSENIAGYWIFRENYFMGKKVLFSGWQNDKVIRLFRKSSCRYEDKMVHAEITTNGKIGYLKKRFYHNKYISFDRHIQKLNRYANWQAIDYDKKTGALTPFHFVIKPCWSFFKHYFIQQGFRDGVVGITIAFLQSYSVFTRYVKIWLLRRGLK
jgi:glycosyltransferase involved in cell wall biosynthesis